MAHHNDQRVNGHLAVANASGHDRQQRVIHKAVLMTLHLVIVTGPVVENALGLCTCATNAVSGTGGGPMRCFISFATTCLPHQKEPADKMC